MPERPAPPRRPRPPGATRGRPAPRQLPHRVYVRRRLTVVGIAVLLAILLALAAGAIGGGGTPPARAAVLPAVEAGVEPWQLPAPVSRTDAVATGYGVAAL